LVHVQQSLGEILREISSAKEHDPTDCLHNRDKKYERSVAIADARNESGCLLEMAIGYLPNFPNRSTFYNNQKPLERLVVADVLGLA